MPESTCTLNLESELPPPPKLAQTDHFLHFCILARLSVALCKACTALSRSDTLPSSSEIWDCAKFFLQNAGKLISTVQACQNPVLDLMPSRSR
eukprot:15014182-Alexandrium_andersonii.AAC.1